jgi:hypothetical protein
MRNPFVEESLDRETALDLFFEASKAGVAIARDDFRFR